MNTKQMEYILELAKMKNFNRAAENLYISQPALTYQIKTVEEEIGFRIFERSGKGVTLTSAGTQFSIVLENVLEELNEAIRQGQTQDISFTKGITIGLPYRSALYYLPEATERFYEMAPTMPVVPHFNMTLQTQPSSKPEWDITFSVRENARRMSGYKEIPLFDSRIYCVMARDDALADREILTAEDIKDRTIITTHSKFPSVLYHVRRSVLQTYHNNHYHVEEAATVLHGVASHMGIALVPGIVNDHSGEFAWVPFDYAEKLSCVLLIDRSEKRKNVMDFIDVLKQVYTEHADEAL